MNKGVSVSQINPDLYVGIYKGQVYVQHSDVQKNKIRAYISQAKIAQSAANLISK